MAEHPNWFYVFVLRGVRAIVCVSRIVRPMIPRRKFGTPARDSTPRHPLGTTDSKKGCLRRTRLRGCFDPSSSEIAIHVLAQPSVFGLGLLVYRNAGLGNLPDNQRVVYGNPRSYLIAQRTK